MNCIDNGKQYTILEIRRFLNGLEETSEEYFDKYEDAYEEFITGNEEAVYAIHDKNFLDYDVACFAYDCRVFGVGDFLADFRVCVNNGEALARMILKNN